MRRLLVACAAVCASLLAAAQSPAPAGRFDYYVLSLSWAPTYCASHPNDMQECGSQQYGFVLHGLWPQYENGGYPATCSTSYQLDQQAREEAAKVFPSSNLVNHEWQKHGTCSGLKPIEYVRTAGQALSSVKIPAKLEPGSAPKSLRAQEISRLLRDANPAMTSRTLAVNCAQGRLSEVRICMDRDLKPRACGNGVRDSCGSGQVRL